MKISLVTTGLITIAIAFVHAADVTYSVIAFPGSDKVGVQVAGQDYPLQRSPMHANLFTGIAPFAAEYRYTILNSQGQAQPEETTRHLDDAATTTGNEFFGRSKTVYDIPALPRAYNPIYPALASDMDRDNEIATLILRANMDAIQAFLDTPTAEHNFAQVYNMTYINHHTVYNFENAGLKNAGQSSKDKGKQSYKVKFNKFDNSTKKDHLFGRRAFKLRAGATDPTLIREKLMMDSLSASGVATLNSHWVRLFINDEPFGLYLMTDDSFKGFTDNLIHGGEKMNSTGVTIKGNAMDQDTEANLVYNGPSAANYDHNDVYILEDKGRDPTISKENYMAPLIDFMDRLSKTVVGTDAQTPGTITDLMDSAEHTMIHAAMSFLAGSWDGFWYQASNYYLNQNRETKKWYLITYDFDETFGNGLEDIELMTTPYQKYQRPGSKRPLIDVFIKSPYYEPKFQEILKTLIKRFYNPRVIKPRLEAWTAMLKEDIAWDRSLPFRSPGDKEKFTVNDLNNALVTVGSRMGVLEWISNRTSSVCQQLNFNDTDDLPALPSA
ncbi:coth protein-domain-containing protein, partial [Mucor mucedo]|uniref:coth protein-domain-containing protein n=1 Tax=Mucor mucedo TaxID=29922 RepID=UPI00221E5A56